MTKHTLCIGFVVLALLWGVQAYGQTETPTITATPTHTFTPTVTHTFTPTRTFTPTPTFGPNDCCQMAFACADGKYGCATGQLVYNALCDAGTGSCVTRAITPTPLNTATPVNTATTVPTSTPVNTATTVPTATFTPTPLNTFTPTPTFKATYALAYIVPQPAIIHHNTVSAAGILTPQGVVCIALFSIASTDGNIVTITDGNSNVMFATEQSLTLQMGTFGPCVDGPVTFTGTGQGEVGWFWRMGE